MNRKDLTKIWRQVPPDYYEEGIAKNILQRLWHTHKLRIFKKLVAKKGFSKVLDVGCASGTLTNKISLMFPSSKVFGVDIYKKSIIFGKKKYPHINFIHSDAHNMPFSRNFFDLVISYETIEHVLSPKEMLKEIKRVLSKKGTAIIAMDSGSLFFRIVWWIWEKSKGKVWKGAHIHPYTHSELEEIIKDSGFKISKKHFSHLNMEVIFVLKNNAIQ